MMILILYEKNKITKSIQIQYNPTYDNHHKDHYMLYERYEIDRVRRKKIVSAKKKQQKL